MKTETKKHLDGSLSVTITIKPTGSFYEQELQIMEATNQAGRELLKSTLAHFDTDGTPVVKDNEKYTCKGRQKKTTSALTGNFR
jgi:hypothetical protein